MDCAAPTLKRRHRQILLFAKLLHRIITAIEPLYQFTPLLNSLSCSPCTHCLTPLLLGTKTLGNVAAFLNTVAHRALTVKLLPVTLRQASVSPVNSCRTSVTLEHSLGRFNFPIDLSAESIEQWLRAIGQSSV